LASADPLAGRSAPSSHFKPENPTFPDFARGTSRAQRNNDMKHMLVAVFDNEAKAYDGFRSLQVLDERDVVAVIASRLITKNLDGSIRVANGYDVLPEATMGGTAVG